MQGLRGGEGGIFSRAGKKPGSRIGGKQILAAEWELKTIIGVIRGYKEYTA
jgi:hypothetical protein